MDSTRPPFDAVFNDVRRLFETLSTRIGPDPSAAASSLLERLQLAPRSEVERLRGEIRELEGRLAELESRLEKLSR